MRNKLALTIALASFAFATALGVGLAGADPSTEATEPLATAPALPVAPAAPLPACSNGLDDDGDGLVDLNDPDCLEPGGTSESPATTAAPPAEAEAAPVEEAPPVGPGVQVGDSLDAGKATGGGKVVHNQSIGGGSSAGGSGSSASGGVSAPPATAGIQPQAQGPSGGSEFLSGGSPTAENPTVTIAPFGPAPIGVPNFIIDSFEIPPFLLPIYQACGTEYGIPWEVLASINKIETAFGTNLNVSSAGAVGWMQFLPSTWETYGVDANGDGRKDPYNPVDAICGAANYLKASGGSDDLYKAVLSYNHADWYVQEVLLYARAYGKIPTDLVGSLTGLTEGAHFPVAADARYADDLSAREALKRATPGERKEYGNAADVISSSPTRHGINIFAAEGAPVVAVNDGVIEKIGHSGKLGKYVVLEDSYGNRFTYAELGKIVRDHRKVVMPTGKEKRVPVDSENIRPRLFALPQRSGDEPEAAARENVDTAAAVGADGSLKVGSKVIAGTVLARIGASEEGVDPHINFSIRPAGKGAPRIDPKPILDGWKLLEATAIYRAQGKNALAPTSAAPASCCSPRRSSRSGSSPTQARHLRMRPQRHRHRPDRPPRPGDARVPGLERLRTDDHLAQVRPQLHDHLRLRLRALDRRRGRHRGHRRVPVTGHQGPGTLTDELIRTVLQLQGTMHPHQVISLEDLPGETSFALPDHYDHVHVGYHPISGPFDQQFNSLLKPGQWPPDATSSTRSKTRKWRPSRRGPRCPTRRPGEGSPAGPKAATDPLPASLGVL